MSTSLAVPQDLYGTTKVIRSRLSAAIRAFAKGSSWDEAMGGPLMTVGSAPGLIVLNGPAPLLSDSPHFHVFLPLNMLLEAVRKGKLPEDRVDAAVSASLETAWGLLGVLSPANLTLVIPATRHRAVASAALARLDELESVGPRYSVGLREGKHFWEVIHNLWYVLGQLEVPSEALQQPSTPDTLKMFLKSVLSTSSGA